MSGSGRPLGAGNFGKTSVPATAAGCSITPMGGPFSSRTYTGRFGPWTPRPVKRWGRVSTTGRYVDHASEPQQECTRWPPVAAPFMRLRLWDVATGLSIGRPLVPSRFCE